jgi:hypothetical protein
MLFFTHTGAWTFFGFIALLVYGYALLRWAYHLAASAVCQRRGIEAARIPLLYFIVTTATFGFWLGAMLYAMAWLFEHWDGRVAEIVTALPASHPSVVLLLVLPVGIAIRVASFNSSAGFLAVYGNSARLLALFSSRPGG